MHMLDSTIIHLEERGSVPKPMARRAPRCSISFENAKSLAPISRNR